MHQTAIRNSALIRLETYYTFFDVKMNLKPSVYLGLQCLTGLKAPSPIKSEKSRTFSLSLSLFETHTTYTHIQLDIVA